MKTAILTFQFAHNYGALLQAYALKQYLKSHDLEGEIAPYYPDWAQSEYAISPFAKGISFRRRVRLASQYWKRKGQSEVFDKFISEELDAGDTFSSELELKKWLETHECVICGSDQIWNNNITGNGGAYFAVDCNVKKISYAASLGTTQLNETQKSNIINYLPSFSSISVREPGSAEQLTKILHREIQVVLDPVFLLDRDEWRKLSRPVSVDSNYLFLYFLQENEKLLECAKKYAEENGLKIYEVHPTLATRHNGCKRLENVGPKEFIWLIENASCVCTNSFHATAFSTIFRKKLIHIPNSESPERTTSLLERVGIELKTDKEFPFYDISLCDDTNLNFEIEKSKKFLDAVMESEQYGN